MSMVDTVIDRVVELGKAAESRFWALARQIAARREPAGDEVKAIMGGAAKSPDDLRAAVATVERRAEWHKAIIAAEAGEKERPKIEAQFRKAQEDYDAAVAKFTEIVGPLHNRAREIDQQSIAASHARDRLFASCPYPELKREHGELSALLAEIANEARELTTRVRDVNTMLASDSIAQDVVKGLKGEHSEKMARAEALALEAKSIQQRQAALEERMREP